MKIVVIEGIDGIGKTTLANGLSKEMGYPIYNCRDEFRFGLFLEEWRKGVSDIVVFDFLSQIDFAGGVIFDRSLPSNFVYRKDWNEGILNVWLEFMSRLDIKMIYLFSNMSVSHRAGSNFQGCEEICLVDRDKILDKYGHLLSKVPSGFFISINVDMLSVKEVLDMSMEYLNED